MPHHHKHTHRLRSQADAPGHSYASVCVGPHYNKWASAAQTDRYISAIICIVTSAWLAQALAIRTATVPEGREL